jgi:uncharacterized protein (TIGR02231 family)
VHLRARAENTTGASLLAGPVSVWVEGASVGATRIEDTPAGAGLELSLGLDERVRVERELVTRNAGRSLGDRVRRLSLGWEITLTSSLDRSTLVEVLDRLPVPADADIKVKVDRLAPEPDERDELGRLTWRLPLPAGGTAAVVLATTVEHPKALDVVGLD